MQRHTDAALSSGGGSSLSTRVRYMGVWKPLVVVEGLCIFYLYFVYSVIVNVNFIC